ncbi:MAG: hypothetical protein HON68_06180 [Gammaproteobacteria bacterium]|jgi:hypothetical protein|nr:hypothetical protein [Gammaproteobacteria bacterium]MBT3489674.1 hypothetical protein [Gammaproteobacteria bacterium]MBT3719276.1 hypothetical protein [Gammaproteobacteria bacterium]MBT3844670.1 hypothetical protein [Gammaproteobacteria bacterium]MBT3892596.1 hypothetical protein [Gammaproteobacteria bacterium]
MSRIQDVLNRVQCCSGWLMIFVSFTSVAEAIESDQLPAAEATVESGQVVASFLSPLGNLSIN